MTITKSKTVRAGDLISLKNNKICKVRKNTKKGPDGIYFSPAAETRLDMNGKIQKVYIPEHIKLEGMVILRI